MLKVTQNQSKAVKRNAGGACRTLAPKGLQYPACTRPTLRRTRRQRLADACGAAHVNSFPKRKVDIQDTHARARGRFRSSDVQVNGRFGGAAHSLLIHPLIPSLETGSDEPTPGTPPTRLSIIVSAQLSSQTLSKERWDVLPKRVRVRVRV